MHGVRVFIIACQVWICIHENRRAHSIHSESLPSLCHSWQSQLSSLEVRWFFHSPRMLFFYLPSVAGIKCSNVCQVATLRKISPSTLSTSTSFDKLSPSQGSTGPLGVNDLLGPQALPGRDRSTSFQYCSLIDLELFAHQFFLE